MNDITLNNSKIFQAFIKKVKNAIVKFDLLKKNDRILAGVSGGPDSVAMLQSLLFLRKEYSLNIGIAHLNHMLRGNESDRDEAFVRKLSDKLKVPFFIEKKDVTTYAKKNRLSTEDSARKLRYAFLKDILKNNKYTKIALGHNKDDNAELILMNILRGTGTKGLTGIPSKRDEIIIRPLIEISKQEIIKLLESFDQAYVIDSSNSDSIYLRNSIRNEFIPLIEKKYNPKIKESLIRLGNIVKDEHDWMNHETEIFYIKALQESTPEKLKTNTIELSIGAIKNCHPALRKRIIRKAIKTVNRVLKKIGSRHIEDVLKLLSSNTSGGSLDLPDQIRIFKKNRSLFIKKEPCPLRDLGENERKI